MPLPATTSHPPRMAVVLALYHINLHEAEKQPRAGIETTAFHEAALEIRRLRARAEAELGNSFDLRPFHDRILEDGAVPLDMLSAKVERWIAGH
jgi:uncharacterized protein (DUF885 family)